MENEYQAPMAFKKSTFDFARFQKPTSGANSERASLLQPFIERLNDSRRAGGYRPYTCGYVASKMSHIATDELDFHYKQLASSKNFCALWHYYNVPKKK